MATCSFIKERKQTAGSMGRVIQYVSQPKKTMDEEGNRYLTGVNCVADVAMQSFMATKHLYGKDTGTFFYQYTQSFAPEEILTPAQAHQIGLELAEQFFPGCEVQTVEQLENVLQHTLDLQKTIQASMATLATKESLEPLATSELLRQWLEQTQALNQETYQAMEEILSEMKEEYKRDGRQRDEFTRELSAIGSTFQKDTQEAISSLRRWIPFIIMSSAAAAVPVCILMWQTLT